MACLQKLTYSKVSLYHWIPWHWGMKKPHYPAREFTVKENQMFFFNLLHCDAFKVYISQTQPCRMERVRETKNLMRVQRLLFLVAVTFITYSTVQRGALQINTFAFLIIWSQGSDIVNCLKTRLKVLILIRTS